MRNFSTDVGVDAVGDDPVVARNSDGTEVRLSEQGDAVERPEPYDAMPQEADVDGEADAQPTTRVVTPGVNPEITNETWWAVLCPTSGGAWSYLALGGESPTLYSSVDKARAASAEIPGSVVFPVKIGINGPGIQRVG